MKKLSFISACFLEIALFFSCSLSSTQKNASLSIVLPDSSSARVVTSSDSIAYYIASISPKVLDDKTGAPNSTILFASLEPDVYTITLRAYRSDDTVYAEGVSEPARVESGKETSVSITLARLQSGEPVADSGEDENSSENSATSESETTQNPADNENSASSEPESTYSETTTDAESVSSMVLYTPLTGESIELSADVVFAENSPYLTGMIVLQENVSVSSELTIAGKLQIDLNEKELHWKSSKTPLFVLDSDDAILSVKNGTISAEGTHSAPLIEQRAGVLVLASQKISDISVGLSDSGASVLYATKGTAYFDSVEISGCVVASASSESTQATIYLDGSDSTTALYAKNATITNCAAPTSSGIALSGKNAKLSYIGGEINMTEKPSNAELSDAGAALLWVSDSCNEIFVSAARLFANSASYPTAVKLLSGGQLNLADGFLFQTYDFENSQATPCYTATGSQYVMVDAISDVESTATIVSYGEKALSASSKTAIELGKDAFLYLSGNTGIFGTIEFTDVACIQQTGNLTYEDSTAKVHVSFATDAVLQQFVTSLELIGLFYKPSDVSAFNKELYELENAGYTWVTRDYKDGEYTTFTVCYPSPSTPSSSSD